MIELLAESLPAASARLVAKPTARSAKSATSSAAWSAVTAAIPVTCSSKA
jgi:hypothetical protein